MYLLLIFLPLYSFIILFFFGAKIGHKGSTYLSMLILLISLLICLFIFYEVLLSHCYTLCIVSMPWINVINYKIAWGLWFDSITVSMLLIIIIISGVVHLYSYSYMLNDPYYNIFISYLSLFTFFMVILVTANNFLQLFIGWEGVGIISYLLISFWYTRTNAVKSAFKAVVINKIGDASLLLAFGLIYYNIGTLDILLFNIMVYQKCELLVKSIYNFDILLLLICIGCFTKSAQFVFHTWLADAMEGPTPVSALLHAATMVTAGVYLLLRLSPAIVISMNIQYLLILIGLLTAFMSASIAVFQDDIKKIIAYSTCSQLGYMFFSCGLLNFNLSFFHLINHAFFKALLFLSAGSIIHSLNDEQDLKKMGGLLNIIPFSYITTFIGSLAIMGFPYLTGFYSKDMLLELIYVNKNNNITLLCILIGLFSAILTNIYSFRILYLVFFSSCRFYKNNLLSIHDSPIFMLLSQLILALFSIFIGFLFSDVFIGLGNDIWKFNFSNINTNEYIDIECLPILLKQLPFLIFYIVCLFVIIYIYIYNIYIFDEFRKITFYNKSNNRYFSIYKFLSKKWYFDLIYNKIILYYLDLSYKLCYKIFERGIVEYLGPLGFLWLIKINYKKINKYIFSGLLNIYLYIIFIILIFMLVLIIL